MTLSNGHIERLAVNAITSAAIHPGSFLVPNIPVGDKGISFDGAISVFADGLEKKESLVGTVPVQVKGNFVENFHDKPRSYSLDMAHYRNYLNSDGVLLLVVEVMISGETKIFYKSLLGMELSQIIKLYGHQQTKSVELRPLEETNLYRVCSKFLNEQKFQPKMLVEKKIFSFDAFQTYTLSSLTFDPAHPKTNSIFEHDFTCYGIVNDTRFPLNVGRISTMARSGLTRFTVNGQSYDLMVEITVEEHKTTLVIEQVFAFTIDENEKRFHFRFIGFHSLDAQLKTIPFIIELFTGHTIEFSGCTLALNEDAQKLKTELKELDQHQQDLHKIARVYQHLGIPQNTVLKESDETDIYLILQALTETINLNQLQGITLKDSENATMINVVLGDKTVVIFYNPTGDTLLINGYSEEMLKMECIVRQNAEKEGFPHSIFTMLSEEALVKSVNFNPDIIMKSFDQIDPFLNEAAFDWTNQFCLKCVRAYDLGGNPQLLDVASYVYSKYPITADAATNSIIYINRLQIQKRLTSELTEMEIEELIQLKREAMIQDNQEMLFCINVLLDNQIEASMVFKQWNQEKQEFYQELPIYKLYLNLLI